MARHVRSPARKVHLCLLLSLALVLAGTGALGVALVGRATPSSPPAQPAAAGGASHGASDVDTVAVTDWVDVLEGLDAARARAYRDGDPEGLTEVYTSGSAELHADQRLVRRYADRGLRVEQLRMDVVDLRLLRRAGDRVQLRVRDRIGRGRVVGPDGRATPLVGDELSDHRMTLVDTAEGWRIARLVRL